MVSGEITVSGKGSVRIPLAARPRRVTVNFVKDPVWIPCNHHHHDKLEWILDHEDEDPRHHHDRPHQHHDRVWVLFIEWEVSNVEVVHWSVQY